MKGEHTMNTYTWNTHPAEALEDIRTESETMLYLDNKDPENMAKKTKAQLKSIAKFNREKTRAVLIRLNVNTDKDILEKLETVPSKQGYVKKLIRDDIEKENQGKE